MRAGRSLDHVQHWVPYDSASQHCPQQRVDGQSSAGRRFIASFGDRLVGQQFSKAHKYKHQSPLVTQVSTHSVCWTVRAFSQQWVLESMYVVLKKRDPIPGLSAALSTDLCVMRITSLETLSGRFYSFCLTFKRSSAMERPSHYSGNLPAQYHTGHAHTQTRSGRWNDVSDCDKHNRGPHVFYQQSTKLINSFRNLGHWVASKPFWKFRITTPRSYRCKKEL